MPESRDQRIRRLAWQAGRRGFKEADLAIGGFARARLSELDDAALDEFEAMLSEPDPDLFAWVMGTEPPPVRYRSGLMAAMQDFVRRGGPAANLPD